MTTPRTTDCALCGSPSIPAPQIQTYVTCPICHRNWFGRLRSGGFSSQQLDASNLMIKNNLLIAVIPAYLSIIEMQLSMEVRDFLKAANTNTYYSTLTEPAQKNYDKGVESFLSLSKTDHLLAVVACMSDVHINASRGEQPLLTHSDCQRAFDSGFVRLTKNDRKAGDFVNNMPADYRSGKTGAARSLQHFMTTDFGKKHAKKPDVYTRYEYSRTMRNRIVHGNFQPIKRAGMPSFTPGHISARHVDFVRQAMGDFVDYLTMLHYGKL